MSRTESKQSRIYSSLKLKTNLISAGKVIQSFQYLESEPLRSKEALTSLYDIFVNGGTIISDKYDNKYLELPTGEILEIAPLAQQFIKVEITEEAKSYLKSKVNPKIDGWSTKLKFVKDFPTPGINFIDIMPVIQEPFWLRRISYHLAIRLRDIKPTAIAAIESRGFFIASLLSQILKIKFVPIRKKGKLPGEVLQYTYSKEYGEDTIEIQKDVFSKEDSVVILDDILATGGTALAAKELISPIVKDVNFAFMLSIKELNAKDILKPSKVITLHDI